ncbi:hypothetical protein OG937_01450 [Streptomyces sp. NBC_00510]
MTGPLPVSYKEFCASYGPGVVGHFLKVLHPNSSGASQSEYILQMAGLYHELYPEAIPHDVYPHSESGAVLWALSAESDALFLVRHGRTEWKIGVWFRQWSQWEEYSEEVPIWLARQAAGGLVIPGLPLGVHGGFIPLD